MTFDQKQKTPLFRYSIIAPPETGTRDPSISNRGKDEGISRKPDQDLQSQIRFLMKEHPRITAAGIHRMLLSGDCIHTGQVSPSTIERFVRLAGKHDDNSASKGMRRYERAYTNEIWYGDTMYGSWLADKEGKKRGYFIALIDDASRFIVAADLFFNDSFENLMTVIRSAVTKFGRPKLFTFDNWTSYRNSHYNK